MTRIKTALYAIGGFLVIPFLFYVVGFLIGVLVNGFQDAVNLW